MPTPEPNAPLLHTPPPRRAQPRSRLREFASALAARLPGAWNAVVVEDFHDSPLRPDVLGRLWDVGHTAWAVEDFVHEHAALLTGPGETILLAVRRPLRPGQFLIASLAPPGITESERHAFAPPGIAVPTDPARAAAAVQRRLLPRYLDGLTAVSGSALFHAYVHTRTALKKWDAAAKDILGNGAALDQDALAKLEAHRAQRDAATWPALEALLFHGPAALQQARTDLAELALPIPTARGLSLRLWTLHGAMAEGARVRDAWQKDLAELAGADRDPVQEQRFGAGLRLRHAAGFTAVSAFADNYPVLHSIQRAAQARSTPVTSRTSDADRTNEGHQPSPPSSHPHAGSAGLFDVAQDGTLHFTLAARDLDDAWARMADRESTETGVAVALGDGVHLTHITYGTVNDTDITPVHRGTVPAPGRPAARPAAGLHDTPLTDSSDNRHKTAGIRTVGDASRVDAANSRSMTAVRTGPAREPRNSHAPEPARPPLSAPPSAPPHPRPQR